MNVGKLVLLKRDQILLLTMGYAFHTLSCKELSKIHIVWYYYLYYLKEQQIKPSKIYWR